MKLTKKFTLVLSLGLALTSSVALSGSMSDSLNFYCQYCQQINPPSPICTAPPEVPDLVIFCGSESWDRSGEPVCKKFEKIVHPCASGGSVTYTRERWMGAGTTCHMPNSSVDHDCY